MAKKSKVVFNFEEPAIPGTDLIDSTFNSTHPVFFLIAFFLISMIILNGGASIRQAIKSSGIVRRKFIQLALLFLLFPIVAVIDAYVPAGPILFFSRCLMIVIAVLMYVSLKP